MLICGKRRGAIIRIPSVALMLAGLWGMMRSSRWSPGEDSKPSPVGSPSSCAPHLLWACGWFGGPVMDSSDRPDGQPIRACPARRAGDPHARQRAVRAARSRRDGPPGFRTTSPRSPSTASRRTGRRPFCGRRGAPRALWVFPSRFWPLGSSTTRAEPCLTEAAPTDNRLGFRGRWAAASSWSKFLIVTAAVSVGWLLVSLLRHP